MPTHYIITNREVVNNSTSDKNYYATTNGEFIRKDGREPAKQTLRFGRYTFDGKEKSLELFSEPELGEFEKNFSNPNKDFISNLGSTNLFKYLKENMEKEEPQFGEVLFFMHGFKTDLEGSLTLLEKLDEKYASDISCPIKFIIMFSWPAQGSIFQYRDDAADAEDSGIVLGRGFKIFMNYLKKFVQEDCGQRIHLMAHSMGARVLEYMVGQLKEDFKGQLPTVFEEIILVGADVDYDVFEKPKHLNHLIDLCERVHIYYHKQDRALKSSHKKYNTYSRLGLCGMKNTFGGIPEDVFEADVTGVNEEEGGLIKNLINHWYYYTSEEVVEDIKEIICGNFSQFVKSFFPYESE